MRRLFSKLGLITTAAICLFIPVTLWAGSVGGPWGTNGCIDCASVPEPGPFGLLILGSVALVIANRFRRNK